MGGKRTLLYSYFLLQTNSVTITTVLINRLCISVCSSGASLKVSLVRNRSKAGQCIRSNMF